MTASRVADYFFVAGVHDTHILPTYEQVKKQGGENIKNDSQYYQQQEQAVNGAQSFMPLQTQETSLKENYTDTSLLGVLDHVQNVIDHFDKERDTARDNVIAVHDKYKRSESEKTITQLRRSDTRKWRSPSDPKMLIKQTKDVPNLMEVKYTPTILMRYPQKNYSAEASFPPYAAMFCFPRDIHLYYGKQPPSEQLHSFAMTDENGATVYGTCIVFYEKLPCHLKEPIDQCLKDWKDVSLANSTIEYAEHLQGKIVLEEIKLEQARKDQIASFIGASQSQEDIEEIIRTCQENLHLYRELLEPVKMAVCQSDAIWAPKSIGVMGKMPWIHLYGDWLRILLDNIVGVAGHRHAMPTIDIESTIINFIQEVPLPPPGRFEIGLMINQRPLFFSRPPINQVPVLKNFSLYPLFRALSPHLILAILETLLSEGKVVFLSQYTGMLSIACEAFRYLLYPFYWQFVFIPVLPERLLTCLQAPVPYIIGFKGTIDDLGEHAADDACIVNLDGNTMHQCQRSIPIPDRQRRKLQSALEQYAPLHTRSRIPYGVPLTVQMTFPKGRMILNCGRSKTTDIFISPSRDSDSSDGVSLWSYPASLMSRPSAGFWSSNASTRSSNDSSSSISEGPVLPQYPGMAKMAKSPPMSPIRPAPSLQSISSSRSTQKPTSNERQHGFSKSKDGYTKSQEATKNRLSVAMVTQKRKKATHHEASHSTPNLNGYNNTEYQTPRHVSHIEGHVMVEVFSSELNGFQGYRCICGKQVMEDKNHLFMCCQDCHLVTHDKCIEQILHPCLPACFDEQKVHDAFIRMFASLLYNYRTGFIDHQEERTISAGRKGMHFSKDRFLKHSDKDTRPFLSNLANSQMFTQFITDRLVKPSQEPEIVVFDEYIKLKLNRSKLKFVKEETPFLNDDSYRVSQIIWATPPEERHPIKEYKRFPVDLAFTTTDTLR